jgi:hypothetical protein
MLRLKARIAVIFILLPTCHASLPLAGAGLLHSDEWLGIQPL